MKLLYQDVKCSMYHELVVFFDSYVQILSIMSININAKYTVDVGKRKFFMSRVICKMFHACLGWLFSLTEVQRLEARENCYPSYIKKWVKLSLITLSTCDSVFIHLLLKQKCKNQDVVELLSSFLIQPFRTFSTGTTMLPEFPYWYQNDTFSYSLA